ncbi:hypothetical protein [Micromonospora sp. NPDC047527]|uniref:glycosyltransferase n=1 Tax=Micromonospora sp. NPDC047527 TaxID=3155144 RepID=UPI0033D6907C
MFSFWDGGRCHLTRVLAVAQAATQRGHEVAFISSATYAPELRGYGLKVYEIDNRPPFKQPQHRMPLYNHAYRHAQRLRALGFHDVPWLLRITQEEISAIDDFRPWVLVNDYRDTIWTAAQVRSVPVVGITHSTGNVDGYTLGWWLPPAPGTALADCRDSFNDVRIHHGLDPVDDEREMFSGDVSVIPSVPEIDPLAAPSDRSSYVGLLSGWQRGRAPGPAIPQGAQYTIYSYIGAGRRPEYGYREWLKSLVASNPEFSWRVVDDPAHYEEETFKAARHSGRLLVERHLPAATMIATSDLVVTHGGHGTVTLAIALGKPVLCVGPYQTCCSTTATMVSRAGAGLILNHSDGPLQAMDAPELGPQVRRFGYWDTDLDARVLGGSIERLRNSPSFAERASGLAARFSELPGPAAVIDIACSTRA